MGWFCITEHTHSTYYVQDTVVGIRFVAENSINSSFSLMEVRVY